MLKANELTEEYEAQNRKPVRWFLATDNEALKKEFYRANKDRILFHTCPIKHSIVDMHSTKRTDSMLCTLVDAYLIASTEKAIITMRSTYGIWATLQSLDVKRVPVRKGEMTNYLKSKVKSVK